MDKKSGIRKYCHVNTNKEGDRFVGVKADSNNVVVYFPIGYQLPKNDLDIRRDIRHLFQLLSEVMDKKDRVLNINKFEASDLAEFPISAYLQVIDYYIDKNGAYYVDADSMFKTSTHGKIDWTRTFRKQKPLMQYNGSPVYTKFVVKDSAPNNNKLITHIHRYCVYESFEKLGWLYVTNMPDKPQIPLNVGKFIVILNDKLAHTNNDKNKRLFKAMKDMLQYIDKETSDKQFYFGTDYFEIVWEKLIDKVFGQKNKREYFPKTYWVLRYGKYRTKDRYPLEPDSIMIYQDKYYVLDAKYYRYGITGEPNNLPNSSSINKQITYGEYIQMKLKLPNESLFNAFIMPYNMLDNKFGLSKPFGNIGEAVGEWKKNEFYYERIQGIVIDTRYLMYNYTANSSNSIRELSRAIEDFITINNQIKSKPIEETEGVDKI
ncbi:LlaJI family restriction endonuclease [Clostridium felsineum]|uniref:LlaJI family restriction endonuclease n=1 Tax=Clostridium felsineum TaxID=36839 RepID=UPI00098C121D|nr:LlaJI family restriction endonuclease [Clostridium felsineum]URZ00279.1 hypothetical protein CLAUR_002670 [Clostridium felsineum]